MKIRISGEYKMFWCFGCKSYHRVDGRWNYNDNPESPTFSPSVLVYPSETLSQYPENNLSFEDLEKWCDKYRIKTPRCHLFIENGYIKYLDDCEHDFANKTILMRDEYVLPIEN